MAIPRPVAYLGNMERTWLPAASLILLWGLNNKQNDISSVGILTGNHFNVSPWVCPKEFVQGY